MSKNFELTKKINHIAFIMDGNGRWAKLRGLPRFLGHKEACNRIIELFECCREYNIPFMSFFAFSTENWNRPEEEINHLMDYLEEFFQREIDYLDSVGTRILISGDLERIRPKTRQICYESMKRTESNSSYFINICLNYGGRDEIVRASKKIALDFKNGVLSLDELNEKTFRNYLWNPLLPDVDLFIRTSGEERISNFLLYEIAYSEFVFTEVKWPDFKKDAFIDCLKIYCSRNRRFGGLQNE